MSSARVLVPVSESRTVRNTVAAVARRASDRVADGETDVAVHLVYPLSGREVFELESEESAAARDLLDRAAVWIEEDLGERAGAVAVETSIVGTREYLFSPGDYADVLVRYAEAHDLGVVVFDPSYNPLGSTPLLPPLEAEVEAAGLAVEEAPVQRDRRSPLLVRPGTAAQFVALLGVSYLFYLLLAWPPKSLDFATGAVSAGVVAVALWGISLTSPVRPARAGAQFLRLCLYAPYLLWEIVRANVHITYVVLHPDLPIDPEMVEFDAAVWSEFPVTTLANSITLTPGTLTVDVERRHFRVHTLTQTSREGLFTGTLERAVRFVFYGISAARIPSPIERRSGSEEGGDGGLGADAEPDPEGDVDEESGADAEPDPEGDVDEEWGDEPDPAEEREGDS